MASNVYISHDSALTILRHMAASKALPEAVSPSPDFADTHISSAEADLLKATLHLDNEPLHLMVNDARLRRTTIPCKWHVWGKQVPPGAFAPLSDDVNVSTPEFTFLQMAHNLPFPQLIQLGYELCGNYVMLATEKADAMQIESPITTPEQLSDFIDRAPECWGKKPARRAIRWIAPCSRSPMETDLALMLSLPVRLGGIQFPKPELNHEIPLPDALAARAGKAKYYIDLYWPQFKFGLEYDSRQEHADRYRANLDKKRLAILELMGLTVFPVTELQMFNNREFDTLVSMMCRKTGRRYVQPSPDRTAKQLELRRILYERFGPNALVG